MEREEKNDPRFSANVTRYDRRREKRGEKRVNLGDSRMKYVRNPSPSTKKKVKTTRIGQNKFNVRVVQGEPTVLILHFRAFPISRLRKTSSEFSWTKRPWNWPNALSVAFVGRFIVHLPSEVEICRSDSILTPVDTTAVCATKFKRNPETWFFLLEIFSFSSTTPRSRKFQQHRSAKRRRICKHAAVATAVVDRYARYTASATPRLNKTRAARKLARHT